MTPPQRGEDRRPILTCLAASEPKRGQVVTYVFDPRRLSGRIEPLTVFFRAHPGQLSLGELPCGSQRPALRLREIPAPVEVRPQLPIAYRAHGGVGGSQIAPVAQTPHLIEKAVGHHVGEAFGETLVQHGPIGRVEAPIAHVKGGERAYGRALQLGDRLTRRVTNFERPLDALTVVRGNPCRRRGVEPLELGMQRRPAPLGGARIELTAEIRARRWEGCEAIPQCA
jgi:hypothetical protein